MIPILTQNIKLIILHQSSHDLLRAKQIGQLFNEQFKKMPNLIIGLQENFWLQGYRVIQQQLSSNIVGSDILNADYQGCLTANGGVAFLYNRLHYRINSFELNDAGSLGGLGCMQDDKNDMQHFTYLYSEGEEQVAAKGVLLAKMMEIHTQKEFFILNTHAQATRPGYEDRIQSTLSQGAAVGELICLLKEQYPNIPVIFMGDLNIDRGVDDSIDTTYFQMLERCLPLTHGYEPGRCYKTYSVLEDSKKILPGLIDSGLQEHADLHLDHVFSDRKLMNVTDYPLLYQGDQKGEEMILSDHRGLLVEVDLNQTTEDLCKGLHFGDIIREQLLTIGRLRSGINLFNCCTKRSQANILFEELYSQQGQLLPCYGHYRNVSRHRELVSTLSEQAESTSIPSKLPIQALL